MVVMERLDPDYTYTFQLVTAHSPVVSLFLQALEQQQDHWAPEWILLGTAPAGEVVSAGARWGGGGGWMEVGQELSPGRMRNTG